jgi:hypothetical protein
MGRFLSLHCDDAVALEGVVGSCRPDILDGILTSHPPVFARGLDGLVRRLVAGTHPRGEHALGDDYLRAFRWICSAYCPGSTCTDVWVDPAYPELGALIEAAEPPVAPFRLPWKRDGAVSCLLLPAPEVSFHAGNLRAIDHSSRADESGLDVEDAVDEILAVMERAERAGRGVYLFLDE